MFKPLHRVESILIQENKFKPFKRLESSGRHWRNSYLEVPDNVNLKTMIKSWELLVIERSTLYKLLQNMLPFLFCSFS